MTTFVLVHGAWGGAHTWRTVRPLLWAAGHHVFTPALTGIGERAHLASPQVCLSTHVDDVVQLVEYEDLTDIVLLGFSYGGMVVAGALDSIGDRVDELVFLDAFVPDDGQAVVDLVGMPTTRDIGPGAEWLVPPRERSSDDPEEAEFAGPRRTDQPVRTFTDAVRLTSPLEERDFALTYIKATGDDRNLSVPDPFWDAADRYRRHPSWRYAEIDSNHMVPQNRPNELVDILLSLVTEDN
jgi:pimeloyl-ACP methyl ester carboxylesterase